VNISPLGGLPWLLFGRGAWFSAPGFLTWDLWWVNWRRRQRFSSECFYFSLSLSFHQCSILMLY